MFLPRRLGLFNLFIGVVYRYSSVSSPHLTRPSTSVVAATLGAIRSGMRAYVQTVGDHPHRLQDAQTQLVSSRLLLRRDSDNKVCFETTRWQHVLQYGTYVIFHPTFFVAPC
jgi:hypothetical protein